MRSTTRIGGTLLVGSLALTLSACGSNDSSTGASGSGSASPGGSSSSDASSSASASAPAAAPTPAAEIASLKGKMTQVTLSPKFLAGLTALKLTPGLIGTAKLNGAVLTFPITGGSVKYYTPGSIDPYVQGMIEHNGSGLTLTDGKTKVGLKNFVVDPGKSVLTGDVTANGQSVVKGADLFFLDGSTLKPLQMSGSDAVLAGTTVSLTKTAAGLLNKTFKTKALAEFFPVGIAKITVATK